MSCGFEYMVDGWIIRLYKSDHHLRSIADTSPLIAGQQFDHALMLGNNFLGFVAASKLEVKCCWLGLGKARQ